MVTDPLLALPVLAATVTVTVPVPVPPVVDRLTHERLSEAVQAQFELEALTKIVVAPPLEVKVSFDDDML